MSAFHVTSGILATTRQQRHGLDFTLKSDPEKHFYYCHFRYCGDWLFHNVSYHVMSKALGVLFYTGGRGGATVFWLLV